MLNYFLKLLNQYVLDLFFFDVVLSGTHGLGISGNLNRSVAVIRCFAETKILLKFKTK